MYQPSYFQVEDFDQVLSFMHAHPFITLIGFDGDYPVATQVPVQIEQSGKDLLLIGHVMKKTDHCAAFLANENVMALFTGAHAYISASVYDNPQSASTWNYRTVQVKGKIKMLDEAQTRSVIENLTNSYEDPSNSPAAFRQLDESYIQKHLKAIMGFALKVTDLKAIFKLSQNHSAHNKTAIINDLENRNDPYAQEIAEEMRRGD
ncbi:MAG: FMN-binding negative transcriptional regulator [Pedobacter sp.]|nr:FMN-binding negative transcriptional regulator [Pedobacter sp.]MDQ8052792.1 FMN-binding negative transcriptional regulator [Pedobacter sp.]